MIMKKKPVNMNRCREVPAPPWEPSQKKKHVKHCYKYVVRNFFIF